jgi:hypothetical protein
MLPVPMRKNCRRRKAHHRMARWETTTRSQRSLVLLEKRIVVIPVHGMSVGLNRRVMAFVTNINAASSTTASPASKLVA